MFVADHHATEQLHLLAQAIPQKRLWRRAQAVVKLVVRDYRHSQEAACARTIIDRLAAQQASR